jgi:hypothetical protein
MNHNKTENVKDSFKTIYSVIDDMHALMKVPSVPGMHSFQNYQKEYCTVQPITGSVLGAIDGKN